MRWKKVASGHAATKASQRGAVARQARPTVNVASGDAAARRSCLAPPHASRTPRPPGPSRKSCSSCRQPRIRFVEIDVVAKPRLQARAGHARLIGVDLPRMHVEDRGLRRSTRLTRRIAQRLSRVGREAEVAAAAGRNVAPEHARGRQRDLQQPCGRVWYGKRGASGMP